MLVIQMLHLICSWTTCLLTILSSLSSTKARLVLISNAVKENAFVLQLVEGMKIRIKRPVLVRAYNVGAIFVSNNITTTSRIKHADIWNKYVHE